MSPKKYLIPVALQTEFMSVIWGILAVISFGVCLLSRFLNDKYWFIEIIGYIAGVISIIYFIQSIVQTRKEFKRECKHDPE